MNLDESSARMCLAGVSPCKCAFCGPDLSGSDVLPNPGILPPWIPGFGKHFFSKLWRLDGVAVAGGGVPTHLSAETSVAVSVSGA